MDCKKGEHSDDKILKSEISEKSASNSIIPSKKRACLLVSLIVLVWNVAATGRQWFSTGRLDIPFSEPAPAQDCSVSTKTGPLTARQKYLIGKKVDINRATYEEVNGLPGISDKVAKAVIEMRERRGRIRHPEELLDVPGIKEKRLKKILPFLAGFPNN